MSRATARGVRAHSRRTSQQDPLISRSSSPSTVASPSRPMSPALHSSLPSSSSSSSRTPLKSRMGPSATSGSLTSNSLNPRPNYTTSGLPSSFNDDDDDEDDALHTFTAADHKTLASPLDIASWRGWANAGMLLILLAAVVMLFGGYPIIEYYKNEHASFGGNTAGYNLGGVNASGQYPDLPNYPRLIDKDTPASAYTHQGEDGKTWNLVFSDEFEVEGRTFWDGDDPFFQGVDLHYWGTNDFEYYHPSAITTKDGALLITMNQEPIGGLNLKSGMLQSWNKLCFNKNAYVEASISLPGNSYTGGFWPGAWMFANLGRPGYGATTDGGWPYSYDSCDIGTLPNQTWPNGTGPDAALTTGSDGGTLSYLPGQRYSACTCPGEDHPGPSHDVGRGIPEVDIIEAQIIIDERHGQVSQTYQIAPYDPEWKFDNSSGNEVIYQPDIVMPNTYFGGVYQQSCSRLATIEDDTYIDQDGVGVVSDTAGQFKAFGVEYVSNAEKREEGYISWISEGKRTWRLNADGLGPNAETEVGRRLIPEEPMALVFNFGASNNFQNVDWANLQFPNYMRIDYVRVYQNDDGTVGCDPDDHPTAAYIEKHANAYNNPNLTTWAQAGNSMPKNRLVDTC